jgi:crotonobetainyl-CoA:carnitine CoA-transferase CaiB-like acyl-CoA transferase
VNGPLSGITVFDLTLAGVGPFATMELAGMGAKVIKFEAPAGDGLQLVAPTQRGLGCLYAHCNLGKRIVVLDFKQQRDRDRARAVLERADVFVQSMRPGVAARLGFGYDDVRAVNPAIVYVDSSAWGSQGPMGRDTGADPPVQAFSGFTSLNGQPGGPGEFYRAHGFMDFISSQVVTLSVLDGLVRRQRTGKSQFVESTMLGASLLVQRTRIAEYFATGEIPSRRGSAAQFVVPDQAFECLDHAYIAVTVNTDEQWRRFTDVLGAESLAANGRLATNAGRLTHRDEVVAALEAIFRTRPVRWWEVLLARNAIPVAAPLDYRGVVNHPQVRANRMIVTLDTVQAGAMDFASYPWRLDGDALPTLPLAQTGADTEAVFAECAAAPPLGSDPGLGHETLGGTLEGLGVVDLTVGVCGPLVGSLLAEMGAQVTKVEPPEGDPAATWGPPDQAGSAPAYVDLNRRKTIVRLDLAARDGRSALEELIAGADLVVDDDQAGLLARAGIDPNELVRRHEGLVHCTITGFGEEGPLAGAPVSELIVQAMATTFLGFGAIGEPPVRMGADAASATTAMHALQGLLAVLWRRYRTGMGQRIGVNMLHSALHVRGGNWTANKDPDEWLGFPVEHPTLPPAVGYGTRDLPVTFNLGRMSDDEYEKLMVDFGMADCLDDPRFAEHAREAVGARIYAHQVRDLWERTTMSMSSREVIDFFVSRNCEAQALNDYPTLFAHPQIAAIDAVAEFDGPRRELKLPWKTMTVR